MRQEIFTQFVQKFPNQLFIPGNEQVVRRWCKALSLAISMGSGAGVEPAPHGL